MVKRPREQYAETYRSPGLRIIEDKLPSLPSATGYEVHSAYVLKAGVVEIEGQRLEFQDIRIYLMPGKLLAIAGEETDAFPY